MKLTLGFSPCPNDTFIFDALVHRKIDTGDFEFDVVLEDVQTLNEWAQDGKLDITKLSFPALFQNKNKYNLLSAGAALGKGVGPLLIAKSMVAVPDMEHCSVAIPGINTTANLLLDFALPFLKNKRPVLFSSIEGLVLNGEVELGVIIHENRFTYQKKGLLKILDLGAHWEGKTGMPIPLGCIAMKNTFDNNIGLQITDLIKKSLEYAFANYPLIPDYVHTNAQAMEEDVMRQHIELYVNKYSLDLGKAGMLAINKLKSVFMETLKF